jgi:hypothetical protein
VYSCTIVKATHTFAFSSLTLISGASVPSTLLLLPLLCVSVLMLKSVSVLTVILVVVVVLAAVAVVVVTVVVVTVAGVSLSLCCCGSVQLLNAATSASISCDQYICMRTYWSVSSTCSIGKSQYVHRKLCTSEVCNIATKGLAWRHVTCDAR